MFLLLKILGVLLVVFICFVVYRYVKVNRQSKKLNAERFARVEELYLKLRNTENISESDVLPFAANLQTRETTFQLLSEYKKEILFPREYYDLVKGAESNLANWLEFPTELDACPDVIEHVKRVTIDFDGQANFVHYEVFRYRMNEPHWAAKNGWMLGVVGPYFDDSKPYDFPSATFSRIGSTENPDEEAKWVHENISLKR
ncbi:MAG: hypothetical protein WBP58_14520 [Chitinophagaceae bacterium]